MKRCSGNCKSEKVFQLRISLHYGSLATAAASPIKVATQNRGKAFESQDFGANLHAMQQVRHRRSERGLSLRGLHVIGNSHLVTLSMQLGFSSVAPVTNAHKAMQVEQGKLCARCFGFPRLSVKSYSRILVRKTRIQLKKQRVCRIQLLGFLYSFFLLRINQPDFTGARSQHQSLDPAQFAGAVLVVVGASNRQQRSGQSKSSMCAPQKVERLTNQFSCGRTNDGATSSI